MTIDQYEIGDEVDVFPRPNDIFEEFTGRIVNIDLENDNITVVDQDDDHFDVDAKQIKLAYNEDTEEVYPWPL